MVSKQPRSQRYWMRYLQRVQRPSHELKKLTDQQREDGSLILKP
jgi:hypothetical protein